MTRHHKPELLEDSNFELRPAYRETLDALGKPPLGVPKECQFNWPVMIPAGWDIGEVKKQRFLYVNDASQVELTGDLNDVVIIEIPEYVEAEIV